MALTRADGPVAARRLHTYDWIENLLGLNMHSADTGPPQFQHPAVGEKIALGSNRMRLERVEPDRVLARRSEDGNWVWTFVLIDQEWHHQPIPTSDARGAIGMVPMEAGSLVI
jgi:hypothetical protein